MVTLIDVFLGSKATSILKVAKNSSKEADKGNGAHLPSQNFPPFILLNYKLFFLALYIFLVYIYKLHERLRGIFVKCKGIVKICNKKNIQTFCLGYFKKSTKVNSPNNSQFSTSRIWSLKSFEKYI